MSLLTNLRCFIHDKKKKITQVKRLACPLKRTMFLLYFAYYYDSANSYAEHCQVLPTDFCLWMLCLTLWEGQTVAWHLHFVSLVSSVFTSVPKKSPWRFNIVKHSCPSLHQECGILMWFANFQNGRCSVALMQYTALVVMNWCQYPRLLLSQNILFMGWDIQKFYCAGVYEWHTVKRRSPFTATKSASLVFLPCPSVFSH